VSERKRWEAEKARQAPPEADEMIEEYVDDVLLPEWTTSAPQLTQYITEADYVAAQEEHELQQMIAAMEQQDEENDATSQHFGSDDEDYDALFMECATMDGQQYQQQLQSQPHQQHFSLHDGGAMDMDMTDG
jgi:hypothetical protein